MVEVYFVLLPVPNMADFICWQTQEISPTDLDTLKVYWHGVIASLPYN